MNPRFYVPDADAEGDLVSMPDDEASHLTRVLRLKAGDGIRVFDGRGHEYDATIAQSGRAGVAVRIGAARRPVAEARVSVTLALAVLKGEKMDGVIRDAVMLGAVVLQPVITARTEVSLTALERGRRRDRWQRIAVSAAKQCGRALVPQVLPPSAFDAVLHRLEEQTLPAPGLMLVEPSAAGELLSITDLGGPPPRETTVLIGPEGGWSPDEISRASAVARGVTLGARTLRADAVPLVALAALFTLWKEL